ncbi:putative WRKY transcription factor 3 isoform X1 [Cucumis melo var. makuwa]|uniref:WRKY transcription factor 3 isoform X1 n=1 Tax=Cucumis melo var. makuwa TaxID=1194695 RepID=A0A5A7SYC5_CUCMM|nr:putative WRKY transcription factor 3 isoform X1 [Cucumis melo var. makuwa]
MGEDDEQPPPPPPPSKSKPFALRPTINLPPRTSMESLFSGGPGLGFGFSPGPMTLVSSFFSDSDDCKSFSQLLAGAMASPVAAVPPSTSEFKSSPGLLDSPGLFSPGQGPFGMTHQQALAQVTMQAVEAYSHNQMQAASFSSSVAPSASSLQLLTSLPGEKTKDQLMQLPFHNSSVASKEPSDNSQSEQRLQLSSCNVDKPADDGYNWRKYGQKQVKGSEFPRSYYKCTHPNCPVKKKVERSLEGQVTEIIYKGEHNHKRPQPNKRSKDVGNSNGYSIVHGNLELSSQVRSGYLNKLDEETSISSIRKKDQESSRVTNDQFSGNSDGEGGSEIETGVNRKDEDEPDAKRRNTEVRNSEPASSHRTLTESRIIVQTTSEVDLLDDGYRWRKYGQKIVKGNPYPRSYYKCTTPGCNVRKHVERASTDPKAVITTYEGKHNHDVPLGKTSSHSSCELSLVSYLKLAKFPFWVLEVFCFKDRSGNAFFSSLTCLSD